MHTSSSRTGWTITDDWRSMLPTDTLGLLKRDLCLTFIVLDDQEMCGINLIQISVRYPIEPKSILKLLLVQTSLQRKDIMMTLGSGFGLSFWQSTRRRLRNVKAVIVLLSIVTHYLALILNSFIISYLLVREEIKGLFLLKLRSTFRFLTHNCRVSETS
jgi:hypothetical protein